LIFEWILCSTFKRIAKNWVWKENLVEPLIFAHCQILENFQFENVKNKECVHTCAQ
jgi:hypothetical protein